jgi:hypothetical protein
MGRKLSPAEADAFTKSSTSLPDQKTEVLPSHGSALQSRIAEALDLSVADLLDRSDSENNIHEAGHEGQLGRQTLTRDCSDLIEAFARVKDPKERQRLLKLVRDAAQMDKHRKPCD